MAPVETQEGVRRRRKRNIYKNHDNVYPKTPGRLLPYYTPPNPPTPYHISRDSCEGHQCKSDGISLDPYLLLGICHRWLPLLQDRHVAMLGGGTQ